jgi:L-rhamnose mutarotase
MQQSACKMQLNPGAAAEYLRRHDAIWPELSALLRDVGIRDYSIFLDEESGILFAVLRRAPDHRMEQLPHEEIMQRWWQHMADIMLTQSDGSPRVTPLQPVFHLD